MDIHAVYLKMVALGRACVGLSLSWGMGGALDTSLQIFLAVNSSH